MHTKWWFKIEDAGILLAAIFFCFRVDARWYVFACMALAPDLGMLGYLFGPRFGAVTYNATHVQAIPLLLGVFAILTANPALQAIALVWIAHIAFDRLAGYGLKMPSGFTDTHLGKLPGGKHKTDHLSQPS
jgi:hypothetical protein